MKKTTWFILLFALVLTFFQGEKIFAALPVPLVPGETVQVICSQGVVAGVPYGDGWTLSCLSYTATPLLPTVTPTTAATRTATPIPTVTPQPTGAATPTRTVTPVPPSTPTGELVAFPGAEGFGAQAIGGRGGRIYVVRNLNDSGAGSLRECILGTGSRVCLFSIGGTIVLNSSIEIVNPYITIAGQSAPGDGITLRSASASQEAGLFVKTHDVIVRYVRFRPGTTLQDLHTVGVNAGSAATGVNAAHNVIFDHVSISWGGDEMLILYSQTHHVTVQWSVIAEGLPAPASGSVAVKGVVLGSDNGPGMYTFHHNLLAHNHQRNPNVDVNGTLDWVNNVVYNWNFSGANLKLDPEVNFVGNYVKPGPNTASNGAYVKLTTFTGNHFSQGNVVDGAIKVVPFAPSTGAVTTRFAAPQVTTSSAALAYDAVLANAGAAHGLRCDGSWYARPDAVDVRIANSVRDNTTGHNIAKSATYNQLGYISTPADVGGWPVLQAGTPCVDTDGDGMPNVWEVAKQLNPTVGDDKGDQDGDGYTNLEEYLNGT